MKSIMQDDISYCFLCGRNGSSDRLEEHHVFGGANRDFSEEDGLKVYICGNRCHRNGKLSVHRNSTISDTLKREAQIVWESKIGSRTSFIKRYGRNYL